MQLQKGWVLWVESGDSHWEVRYCGWRGYIVVLEEGYILQGLGGIYCYTGIGRVDTVVGEQIQLHETLDTEIAE